MSHDLLAAHQAGTDAQPLHAESLPDHVVATVARTLLIIANQRARRTLLKLARPRERLIGLAGQAASSAVRSGVG